MDGSRREFLKRVGVAILAGGGMSRATIAHAQVKEGEPTPKATDRQGIEEYRRAVRQVYQKSKSTREASEAKFFGIAEKYKSASIRTWTVADRATFRNEAGALLSVSDQTLRDLEALRPPRGLEDVHALVLQSERKNREALELGRRAIDASRDDLLKQSGEMLTESVDVLTRAQQELNRRAQTSPGAR